MAASQNYNVNLNIQANTSAAKQSLAELSAELTKLSQGSTINLNAGKMSSEIREASKAAMELQTHLQNATNSMTGKLDFSKLTTSLAQSGKTLQSYSNELLKLGPQGAKAFTSLATQIAQAEIPLKRTNKLYNEFKTSLSNTVKWQLSSSIIHGMMSSVQRAFGYAKDLNKSLNDIRIVTNQSSDQMAHFAVQANKAAKSLSTTTTEYTKASLIYYQQGLSDKEVQDRTNITIKMANVTGQSAQKVSDQMTAVWNNYANGTEQLSHYADVMTALGAATASSTDEIAQGLQKFASISDTVGLSYEYAASALATVTATTRESADVVGNAFKTLFSRIQGLQLGETLDDGTTLNKYSQGLAKVGIQIKDSAGEMKNMDTILDEMGSKWSTLAQDEKMALAQTVAGVRQYTQLMALMENWDYFKENLNIANTSTGSLQRQQDIYEQSWNAANQRLRASFEGLWDSLINSDSFIGLTNGLTSIVDMITTISKSLGGGGGVLSLLGAGLTKIYSKELVKGIESVGYSVKNLFSSITGKGQTPLHGSLQSYVNWAQERLNVVDDPNSPISPFQGMPNTASALQNQLGNAAYMQSGLARYGANFSPEQQAIFQQGINYVAALDQRATMLGEAYDTAQLKLGDQAALTREALFQKGPFQNLTAEQLNSQVLTPYIQGNRALGAANALFGNAGLPSTFAQGGSNAIEQAKAGIANFQQSYGNMLSKYFGPDILKPLDDIVNDKGTLDENAIAAKVRQFNSDLQTKINGTVGTKLNKNLQGAVNALGESARQEGQAGALYGGAKDASGKEAENLVAKMQQASSKMSVTEGIVQAAQAMMLAGAAAKSFAGVVETLGDTGEISKADKAAGVIGGIISTLITGVMSFASLSKITAVLGTTAGPIVAVIGAVAMALINMIPTFIKWNDAAKLSDIEKASKSAENIKKMYETTKTYNEGIIESISNYEKARNSLNKMTESTGEWATSLYEANKIATDLIQKNNLQEGKDYYRDSRGAIQITQSALEEVQNSANKNIQQAKLANDFATMQYENAIQEEQRQKDNDSAREKMSRDFAQRVEELYSEDANKKWQEIQEARALAQEYANAGDMDKFDEQSQAVHGLELEYQEIMSNDAAMRQTKLYTLDADEFSNIFDKLVESNRPIDENLIREVLNNEFGEDTYTEEMVKVLLELSNNINNMANSEEQRGQAEEVINDAKYENMARQTLSDENFTNSEEVLKGSGTLLKALEEASKEQAAEEYETKDFKELGLEYARSLGMASYDGFNITGKNENGITYSYNTLNEDGKNETISGTFTKDQIIAFQSGQIALEGLAIAAHNLDSDLTQLDNSTVNLDKVFQDTGLNITQGEGENQFTSSERAATGSQLNLAKDAVASYLSQGDFGAATFNELNSLIRAGDKFVNEGSGLQWQTAQAILQSYGFNKDDIDRMAKDRGLTTQEFLEDFRASAVEAYNTYKDQLDLVSTQLTNESSINQQRFGKINLGDMSIDDLTNLEAILNNLNKTGVGDENGIAYMTAIQNLLDNVQGVEDKGALLSELLKIDPSGADAIYAIIAAVDAAGGSFEGGAGAAYNFASAIASISAPNLDNLVNQLNNIKSLLNDVYSLTSDSNVDDATYEALIAQFPQLTSYFRKNALGGWDFGGDPERARDIARDTYFDKGEQLVDFVSWARDFDGKTFKASNGMTFNTPDQMADIITENLQSNMQLYPSTSWNQEAVFSGTGLQVLTELLKENGGQLGIGAQSAVLSGMGLDSTDQLQEVYDNYYNTLMEAAALTGDQKITDTNQDGVIGEGDEGWENVSSDNKAIYAELNAASAKLGQIASILAGLPGAEQDLSDWNAERGSLAKDTDELASMYGVSKNTDGKYIASANEYGTASENLNNYVNGLVELGEAYDYSRNLAYELRDAQAAGNEELVQALIPQTEMATAIAAEAQERGISAETLEYYTRDLMEMESLQGASAKQIAEMAGDLAVQAEGLEECAKNGKQWINTLTSAAKGSKAYVDALNNMSKSMAKVLKIEDQLTKGTAKMGKAFEKWVKDNPGKAAKAMAGDLEAGAEAMEQITKDSLENRAVTKKGQDAWQEFSDTTLDSLSDVWQALDQADLEAAGTDLSEAFKQTGYDAESAAGKAVTFAQAFAQAGTQMGMTGAEIQSALSMMGFELVPVTGDTSWDTEEDVTGVVAIPNPVGYDVGEGNTATQGASGSESVQMYKVVSNGGPGGGSAPSGGGGGGGGGPKEPKKVANKRKSQTVKRYKKNDFKRKSAEKSKKSEENKKDYLYGESKIAQMEKINKLAEKEAKITADRIKESRRYLVEDRENLIKYMQKYGFEAEFDSDGFLSNYEKAWTEVYEEIAALYEDNELTEDEEKIEEELNIKLEELEGALEDYENSLNELLDDIEKWEETLFEMFDNEIEQMEHKVEFKLELDEDSLEYIDFLIENLGDSAVQAIDKIELIADKTDYLFNSIETAYQGVQDIYALSDSPLHLFATGGADIDGLLTESQVEALRNQTDSLIDFADQLREIRDTIQEQVSEVFDMWTEKVNHNISALEQYGSVMEYFKNIVDLTGNDIFGLSTDFVRNMESAQIDQSIDQMEANKAYYEQLQEMRANVEYELQKAQMSGDEERIAYWEEHLRTVEEEMQSAQDSMLSALENTLTMISDQFAIAMEDAVEAFNKSIYSSGGLEGLSTDYSLLREEADLMAEDYDKIYQLSKISRNINKTLDDTKIIAGKQRLNGLLSEINDLQASGVEMSKYDLEYLEAKYQLYLAQIELENSQHDKDTVRLTRDSEGNWGYVYTTNEEKVNEAQQKYEDALYEMQNKNHEYLDEMSSSVIDLTQQMNEEIAALEISDFANLEEYNARVEEIQQKYLAQIERRESELDKAITNNQDLYEKDWKAYSEMTGYKISADKEWIDSFKETTLGYLTESESVFSDFGTRITEYAATLAETLSGAAGSYFSQIEEALNAYDTSIAGFGAHITTTYKSIQDASDTTAQKTTEMATQMKDAFNQVVTTVGTWQDTEGLEITEMLDEIATYLKDIFEAINKSANIKTDSGGPIIGQQEAVNLLSGGFEYNGESYSFGSWKFNSRGDLDINDGTGFNKSGSNLVDYHAYLATQVQDAMDAYYSNPEDEMLKAAAEALIKKYWAYRSIIDRVYDPGEIEEPNVPKGFDTGGYTGEWGNEGKLAMLHEKELILNADDTANFLEALNISRDVIHSMIEMNARASSLGLGDMIASSIKDNTQTIEQTVHITAEFPEATDRNEIEAAFDNLINMASQYAFRSE